MEAPSSTELVILGLLKRRPAHGYELLRTVQSQRMAAYIQLAPSGMYKALARLEEQGCVTVELERRGNRPERQTYTLTKKGEVKLHELLLSHLHAPLDHIDPFNAALTFGELVPRAAVLQELRRRRDGVVKAQEEADHLLAHVLTPSKGELLFPRLRVERWADHLEAERRWLEKSIAVLDGRQEDAGVRAEVKVSIELPTGQRARR